MTTPLRTLALTVAFAFSIQAADKAPLKVLLLTGGCCHDYKNQKDILKKGLEERVNCVVDQIHTDNGSTKPPLPIYGNPDYAKGYDLVIHDECAADNNEQALVEGVLKPHRDGIPAVNLHCAMHSYRIGNQNDPVTTLGTPHGFWFEYLGLQSSAHGAQLPITITLTNKENPIVRGLPEWTTVNEELYNNIRLFDNTVPLLHGAQVVKSRDGASTRTNTFVVAWSNTYGDKKTRVFSTTIGHNNSTVQDTRYLDLVARGLLWATGHLKNDGTPEAGYGK